MSGRVFDALGLDVCDGAAGEAVEGGKEGRDRLLEGGCVTLGLQAFDHLEDLGQGAKGHFELLFVLDRIVIKQERNNDCPARPKILCLSHDE